MWFLALIVTWLITTFLLQKFLDDKVLLSSKVRVG